MADHRRRHNGDEGDNAETMVISVSVKDLRKEFGGKGVPFAITSDDEDTFVSVRERLRRFDSRQDEEYDCDNENDDGDGENDKDDDEDTFVSVRERLRKFDARDNIPDSGRETCPRAHNDDDDDDDDNDTYKSVRERLRKFDTAPPQDEDDGYHNDDNDDDTFKSVRDRLRRFDIRQGEEELQHGGYNDDDDNDDDTYKSVRERLRKFDTPPHHHYEEDDDVNETYIRIMDRCKDYIQPNHRASMASSLRDSMGSITTTTTTATAAATTATATRNRNHSTPRNKFGHLRSPRSSSKSLLMNSSTTNNSVDQHPKSFPPLTVSFLSETVGNGSSSSLKENPYGSVLLKRVDKPVEDRWKQNAPNDESMEEPGANERSKRKATMKRRSDPPPHTTTTRSYTDTYHRSPVHSKNKPKSFQKRGTSLNDSAREEKYQTDVVAALKKVGLPIEDRWKSKKNADEQVSDSTTTSRPVFATMKLRSIASPTSSVPIASSASRNQYFYGSPPTTTAIGGVVKQKHDFDDDDDGKQSTLAKRRRIPEDDNGKALSVTVCTNNNKVSTEGNISVSSLAKVFSTQIKLASNGELAEEEKFIGRVSSVPRSTAKELDDVRKSLNSSTPVSILIAQRNKAAKANRSEEYIGKKFGSPEEVLARIRAHRRTASVPPRGAENSNVDGRDSIIISAVPHKRSRDGDPVSGDCGKTPAVDCWEIENGDIWNMNLDNQSFSQLRVHIPHSDGNGNTLSCPTLEYDDDGDQDAGPNINGLSPSNSTLSEYTTDSDGNPFYDYRGHSRYIQITLSSGGITEKFEPNIVMTSTEESSLSNGTPMIYYDASPDPKSDTRRNQRMLVPLKGAKKFFFGKTKKKSTPVEV